MAAQEKIDLGSSRVRTLIVAGEPGGTIPAVSDRLTRSWPGARVFDHHGMTEVGPVTYQCPAQAGILHVIESAYFPEIIEPASADAVKPGQTGELVLTTLGRSGSPLLRFRTGDLVKSKERGEPCECGRYELALEGGILGRTDDMVVENGSTRLGPQPQMAIDIGLVEKQAARRPEGQGELSVAEVGEKGQRP